MNEQHVLYQTILLYVIKKRLKNDDSTETKQMDCADSSREFDDRNGGRSINIIIVGLFDFKNKQDRKRIRRTM